jgi:hypothetical protein
MILSGYIFDDTFLTLGPYPSTLPAPNMTTPVFPTWGAKLRFIFFPPSGNPAFQLRTFFESYGFIHGCIIINDKELVIRNDSMGGHIHIITSLVTTHGFLCRRHFLANVLRVIGTELWFC